MKKENVVLSHQEAEKLKESIWSLVETSYPENVCHYKALANLCAFADIDLCNIDCIALTERDLCDLIHEGYDELNGIYDTRYPGYKSLGGRNE